MGGTQPEQKPLRIAVLTNFYPPRPGGSSHLSDAIAERLAERGHEVLVITCAYGGVPASEEISERHGVIRVPSWQFPQTRFSFNFDITFALRPGALRRVTRLLDEFKPDILHLHGQFLDLAFLGAIYARRREIPTVLTVHTRLESPGRLQNWVFRMLDATVVRYFVRKSRPIVIALDGLMDRYVRRRYGIPDSRIERIPVGIDVAGLSRVHSPSSDHRAIQLDHHTLRFEESDQVVLSVGHVIPVRNRLSLVEAMPAVLAAHPRAKFVVVGGIYDNRFLRLASDIGVEDNLIAPGPVPKDIIPDLLAVADVEAHDLSGHGLGTAGLEVMAAGVPHVVAVPADHFDGVPLESWHNVVLVTNDNAEEIAHALIRLLQDSALRSSIGERGQALVQQHFDIEAVVDRHVDLYQRLAEG